MMAQPAGTGQYNAMPPLPMNQFPHFMGMNGAHNGQFKHENQGPHNGAPANENQGNGSPQQSKPARPTDIRELFEVGPAGQQALNMHEPYYYNGPNPFGPPFA